LNRRFDIFVKSFYRLEGTLEASDSQQSNGFAPWG
jgi:hypothetical protein